MKCNSYNHKCFNTQPRGGGCNILFCFGMGFKVSTHSRAEAAAVLFFARDKFANVSTHSRAEAAAFL